MFNVTIMRSPSFTNLNRFEERCLFFLKDKAVSGEDIMINTNGDEIVEKFAQKYYIMCKKFPTEWKKYGKNALKERNTKMLSESNAVILFNDNTTDIKCFLAMAKEANVPYRVVNL